MTNLQEMFAYSDSNAVRYYNQNVVEKKKLTVNIRYLNISEC